MPKTNTSIYDPQHLERLVRAHWAIENNLHWIPDVAFNEFAPPADGLVSCEFLSQPRLHMDWKFVMAFDNIRETTIQCNQVLTASKSVRDSAPADCFNIIPLNM